MRRESEQPSDSDRQAWLVDGLQFRSLLEVLPAGAYTCDAAGLITYFNRQAVQLWGRAPQLNDPVDRFCGSFKLYSPDGTPIAHEDCWMALALRTGEPQVGQEIVIERPDGSRLTALAHANPLRNEAGEIVGAANVLVDITEQKRAAKALRNSEQRFGQFMQNLPGLAWIKDIEGRYVFVNDAAERAFGKYCENVYGKRDEEIFPAETAAQFREHDRQVLTAGVGETVETLEHDDGVHHSLVSKFPIPGPTGEPAMVGGIAVDITERKEAEEALVAVKDELAQQLSDLRRLHAMSMRLSTTLELQPILEETLRTAAAIEGADRALLSLCDREQRKLRLGASLGFDADILGLLDGVPLGAGACGTCYAERHRIVVEDVETDPLFAAYRDVARQAGIRSVHSTPLITRSGKIVGVLSTHSRGPHRPSDRTMNLIDLCARQAADFIENARLYHELREADRRKDEFLATLAHELRNPLAPLSNSLQLLRLSDDLTPAVQHVREIMERQVNHMVRLVDDLLEVARITQGKIELRKELVELSAVIGSAVETSRPLIEAAGHQLAVKFSAASLLVEADPVRLAQVIANLLNNAAKFTPRGGQIWLTARRDRGQAVVSVRDNGQGISADMLPRVFDMFAQVEHGRSGAQSGLGIGLALAKRLIQMHGGGIHATSGGIGRGSEFVVSLPLSVGGARVKLPTKMVRPLAAPAPSRRILVVDDTESSAYILGKLLETLGQEVITAEDAAAALTLARTNRPQVIFSDIAMPGIDGYELARRMRSEPGLESVVLVALTGYGQDKDRQRARDAGFDYYLVKPVKVENLQDLLASLPPLAEPDVLLLGKPVGSTAGAPE